MLYEQVEKREKEACGEGITTVTGSCKFWGQVATRIMEYKEYIIATFERLKAAIMDLWESIKKPALELAEAIKAAETGKGGKTD